jgi:hypothetical protein
MTAVMTIGIQGRASAIYQAAQKTGKVDSRGVLLDLNPHSDFLVISCSGIVPGKVIYAMENSSRQMTTNKIFICDSKSLWYYSGIEGLTQTFDETTDLIKMLIDFIKPNVTCAIGTSGGGYMSLALGAKLGLDRSLALSPQTNISAEWRSAHNDTRWADNMSIIHERLAPQKPFDIVDLIKDRIADVTGKRTEFHVIYPSADALDMKHATRLEGVSQVETYSLDGAQHNISAELRRRGKLSCLLDTFIHHNGTGLSLSLNRIINQQE